MYKTLFCFFIVITFSVHSQPWKDSLIAGKNAYKQGDYSQAYKKMIASQRLAPEDIDLTKDIGTVSYRTGDFETAEKAFTSAAENTENVLDRSKKWHNVGNSQFKQKNYTGAIESYKKALRENPSDDKARYNLAEAQRRLKKQQAQKDKQSQEENQRENQQQNNDNNSNDQNQREEENNRNENRQNENQQQDRQTDDEEERSAVQKLSDKRIERMLDKLMKQEMETKRKVQTREGKKDDGNTKSGKKW